MIVQNEWILFYFIWPMTWPDLHENRFKESNQIEIIILYLFGNVFEPNENEKQTKKKEETRRKTWIKLNGLIFVYNNNNKNNNTIVCFLVFCSPYSSVSFLLYSYIGNDESNDTIYKIIAIISG